MKENVRKQWRIHLCCGRFRLSNYSGSYCKAKKCFWMCGCKIVKGKDIRVDNPLISLSFPLCPDWSRSVTVGGHQKKNNLVNSESVASDNTSTLRKISDSSTGSAPNHHQGAWAGLSMHYSVWLSLSRSIVQSQTLLAKNRRWFYISICNLRFAQILKCKC